MKIKKTWYFRRLIPQAIASLSFIMTCNVMSQESSWPQKPIRFLVGFAPGGVTDVMARAMAQVIGDSLGKPILVENKLGAGGNISVTEVIRAPADGYTFLIAPNSIQTTNPFIFKQNINPEKDLMPIAGIGRNQMYLVVKPNSPFKDAKQLVNFGRLNQGSLSYASSGTGTPPHLAGELFKKVTQISSLHIPYRGSVPALQDTVANQVDYVFDPGLAFQHVRSGKVRMLAVASSQRSPFFPDVPTMSEIGYKGAELDAWYGMWAPNGISTHIVERMTQEIEKAINHKNIKIRYEAAGAEAIGLDNSQFREQLSKETKVLSALIKSSKISAD